MAKVPLGKLARAMRQVSSGMGASGWLCSDIVILLSVFMKYFLMSCFLYFTRFSFPCPLVQTKFPSRVIHTPNHVWGIDIITYIRMLKGWMYLVAVLDWYSRYT